MSVSFQRVPRDRRRLQLRHAHVHVVQGHPPSYPHSLPVPGTSTCMFRPHYPVPTDPRVCQVLLIQYSDPVTPGPLSIMSIVSPLSCLPSPTPCSLVGFLCLTLVTPSPTLMSSCNLREYPVSLCVFRLLSLRESRSQGSMESTGHQFGFGVGSRTDGKGVLQ